MLVSDDRQSLVVRVGVIDGRASSTISAGELRQAALGRAGEVAAVVLSDGRIGLVSAPSWSVSFAEVLHAAGLDRIETEETSMPAPISAALRLP